MVGCVETIFASYCCASSRCRSSDYSRQSIACSTNLTIVVSTVIRVHPLRTHIETPKLRSLSFDSQSFSHAETLRIRGTPPVEALTVESEALPRLSSFPFEALEPTALRNATFADRSLPGLFSFDLSSE